MNRLIHNSRGTRAVVITANDERGPFRANLYVNCNPVFRTNAGLGDITLMRKSAVRLITVEQWAQKQLETS